MPLLLCDLDETVLDRSGTFLRWATGFAAERGLGPEALDEILAEDGGGYRDREEFASALTMRYQFPEPFRAGDFMASFAPMFRCEPSTREALLAARSDGWKIAIVTNGGPGQMAKVRAAELEPLVDVICISDVEGCRKPDPRLLRIAAERAQAGLDGSWVIGDNADADIGAANAAGIDSVWMRLGRCWDLPGYRPTAEADSFAEAVGIALAWDQAT